MDAAQLYSRMEAFAHRQALGTDFKTSLQRDREVKLSEGSGWPESQKSAVWRAENRCGASDGSAQSTHLDALTDQHADQREARFHLKFL